MRSLGAQIGADGRLAVRVTPKSAADRIVVEGGTVKVHVTAAPDKGKANAAVVALVAQALGVPRSSISVVRGEAAREKMLWIKGWNSADAS